MTAAAAFSSIVAALSVALAVCAAPFVALPRWRKHRMLVAVALGAAVFAAGDAWLTSTAIPDAALVWVARARLAAAALTVASWLKYTEDDLGPLPRRAGSWSRALVFALAAGSLVPGLLVESRVETHTVPELHLAYRDVLPTTLGAVAMGLLLVGLVLCAVSYAEAAIRGVPHASGHFVALLALLVCGANDAIVSFGVSMMPYLLDLGILVQTGFLAVNMTRRWAHDIAALAALPRPRGLTEVSNPGFRRP